AKVELPQDPAACWLFLGTITADGIGKVMVNRKQQTVQRWMFEQLFGPLPEGFKVGTTCGNGRCFNPHHLVARTHAEATRGGAAAILTSGDLADIRRVPTENRNTAMADALASRIGCTRRAVQDVWRGVTWARTPKRIGPRPQCRKAATQQATA
ncbi:MAG TPA: HNH endonuclease, partial [Arenimonas sp.]